MVSNDSSSSARPTCPAVRIKFLCQSVTKRQTMVPVGPGRTESRMVFDAQFYPITNGSDDDRRIWAANPGGQILLSTMRGEQFVPGKTYCIEFSEVE